jgi:predicted DCC family thiol-disulfide oxidoreductase YuxK
MKTNKMVDSKKIVFFDGVCGLCHGFIQFLFWVDKKNIFKVAPLQGQTAQKLLNSTYTENLTTVIFFENGNVTGKFQAIIEIFKLLSFPWNLLSKLFSILPLKWGDFLYDLVAKNRFKFYSPYHGCPLPSPQQREKFLP